MIFKEIFDRNIFRDINPAVVVSDRKQATIEAEIKEYVFTDELIEKLFIVLNTILNKKSGKTGIWINGYYGSGKSHFIKYVHYLLHEDTSKIAFEALQKAVELYDNMKPGASNNITEAQLKLLQKRISASSCDNIMFNVEDETDDGSQERLTRIFLNMFNKFRGYNSNDIPLAILLEKPLDQQGLLDEFKKKIEDELAFDWNTDAAQLASFQLQDVLEIAQSVYPSLDIVSLHAKLSNPESFKIGINATLIPELQGYLKTKDKDYRLLFLVDEVSQYVGANKEILLNFQNIIERVSEDCNNQVWIACTAQQTLDEVSMGADGVMDIQDEFGKILGRFDTRISLQSNDASYITQRRVLDKNSEGLKALNKMYDTNKDYIENQFKISHELYKGYRDIDEFNVAYPFVPYQFKLIAHVFEAFQQLRYVIKEVKDNERSVLGITHYTIKQHAEESVGEFIPFDAFYNQQFHTNLTNRGSKAIQNALELTYVRNNPFAQRVVKVLFMISNLLENQRQTFPSNIDNLTVLLMDQLDQNKMQLQKNIKEVLDKLIEESIIREEKASYFFFNEDEMDVQNLIKSQTIGLDERWKTFDEDFFRPLVRLNRKHTFGQNDFNVGYYIENKEIFRNGDFKLAVLLTDRTDVNQKALESSRKDLLVCINEWFNDDETLRKDFDWYCKTNKYFINNSGGAAGERSKTIENFKIRNNQLKGRLEQRFKNKFPETRFITQQRVLESDQVTGSSAADRFNNIIDKHLEGIYKNHKLSVDYARTTAELKASAANTQVMAPILSPAEQIVDDFITANNNQIVLYDLIHHFEKEPFGWRHEAIIDILVHLVKKKKREFKYKGQQRYPIIDFVNKAVSTAERHSCEVVTGEDIDKTILDNTVKAFKNIFNEPLASSTDGNEQYELLQTALTKLHAHYERLEEDYYGKYRFGKCFQSAVSKLSEWRNIRDPKKLFTELIDGQIPSKELFDLAKGMEDFTSRALSDYDKLKVFYDDNRLNFSELSKADQEKAEQIKTFLDLEDPRKEFRHILKAKEELEDAIKQVADSLKKKVQDEYKEIFQELEKEAAKQKVDLAPIVDTEWVQKEIDNDSSLSSLKKRDLEANNFKAGILTKIIEATPKPTGSPVNEPETYYVSSKASTISNEEELDEYLTKVRKEMLSLIKNNKTIILK
tara:strand:+ start:78521 stop:82027 length:3507 start_codon:yes stop_codon:yes gene_type:complete